jgi:hypothetical protein
MKSSSAHLTVVFLLMIAASGIKCTTKSKAGTNEQKGFAVVELFTSEGCSSCPAADAAVARLVAKNQEQVYVLSYHVDYWNNLGWKDSFSKAEYSQRQRNYASRFNINSIYTPQIVVNGSSEFVGSNETRLKDNVTESRQQAMLSNLSINTTKTEKEISVDYSISGDEEVLLNIALVQPEATTEVKRGENSGRKLHHVNIVRSLQTIAAKGKGTASVEISKELAYIPLNIIAFTQAKKTLKVLGADRKVL